MDPLQLTRFIERYMAMWHEPDAQRRRAIVQDLWAEDAENITRKFVVRGWDEIVPRVTRAHDEWVADKGFVFRPRGNADAHHRLVKFSWQMQPRDGGPVEAHGLDILVLRDDGRIGSLYQFAEPLPG